MRGAMHPGAWISWSAGAGMVAFVTTDPVYLLLVVGACWFVHSTHRVPGPGARSFRLFLIAGVFAVAIRTALVFLGTVNVTNVTYAFLEGLRLATILVVFGTFNSVTDPYGVVRLAPRRFHEPALAVALALSIAPRTVASVARVRDAQRLRGIDVSPLRALPALAVPVLASGMEQAVTLAESMDARGHGRGRRSRYRPQAWSAPAAATALTALLAAACFLWAAFGGFAPLHPSQGAPFDPDIRLIAAIGLLAMPGLTRGSRS